MQRMTVSLLNEWWSHWPNCDLNQCKEKKRKLEPNQIVSLKVTEPEMRPTMCRREFDELTNGSVIYCNQTLRFRSRRERWWYIVVSNCDTKVVGRTHLCRIWFMTQSVSDRGWWWSTTLRWWMVTLTFQRTSLVSWHFLYRLDGSVTLSLQTSCTWTSCFLSCTLYFSSFPAINPVSIRVRGREKIMNKSWVSSFDVMRFSFHTDALQSRHLFHATFKLLVVSVLCNLFGIALLCWYYIDYSKNGISNEGIKQSGQPLGLIRGENERMTWVFYTCLLSFLFRKRITSCWFNHFPPSTGFGGQRLHHYKSTAQVCHFIQNYCFHHSLLTYLYLAFLLRTTCECFQQFFHHFTFFATSVCEKGQAKCWIKLIGNLLFTKTSYVGTKSIICSLFLVSVFWSRRSSLHVRKPCWIWTYSSEFGCIGMVPVWFTQYFQKVSYQEIFFCHSTPHVYRLVSIFVTNIIILSNVFHDYGRSEGIEERIGKVIEERIGKGTEERIGKGIEEWIGKVIGEKKWKWKNVISGSLPCFAPCHSTHFSFLLALKLSHLRVSPSFHSFPNYFSFHFLPVLKVCIDPSGSNDGHSFDPWLSKRKDCKCCGLDRCLSSASFLHGKNTLTWCSSLLSHSFILLPTPSYHHFYSSPSSRFLITSISCLSLLKQQNSTSGLNMASKIQSFVPVSRPHNTNQCTGKNGWNGSWSNIGQLFTLSVCTNTTVSTSTATSRP